MQLQYSKTVKVFLTIISIAAVVYMIAIYARFSYYTVYSADDFTHANSYRLIFRRIPFHLLDVIFYTLGMWVYWQGNYTSSFFIALFNPLVGFGYPQLKVEMAIFVILMMLSIVVLIYELFQLLFPNNRYMAFLFGAVSLFASFGFEVYHEVFFWFTGNVSYGLPFASMFIGVAFLLRYYRTGDEQYIKLSKLFGVVACGGPLVICGPACFWVLLIIVYFQLVRHKADKKANKVFVWWLVSTLVTFSPGNFRRLFYENTGVKIKFFDAIKNSVIIYLKNIKGIIDNSFLIYLALLCIILGLVIGIAKLKDNAPKPSFIILLFSIVSVGASFVSCFPVVFGYQTLDYLPDRCLFVINTIFVTAFLFSCLVLGMVVSSYFKRTSYVLVFLCLMLLVLCCKKLPHDFNNNKYLELNRQLSCGEIQRYYSDCKNFYQRIDSYEKGTDVVFPIEEMPAVVPNVEPYYYYEEPLNPENWRNKDISTYYGLNSFIVK